MNEDMILANPLYNICAMPKIFPSKQAIIVLAERVKARRVLGMRPGDRSRCTSFNDPSLSQSASASNTIGIGRGEA